MLPVSMSETKIGRLTVGSLSIFEPGQYLGVKSVFGQIQYLGTGVAGAIGSDFPYNCHTNHCERLIITAERKDWRNDWGGRR